MCHEFRQSFTLLPRCSNPWIRISKPTKRTVDKFICRRRFPAAALSVERPAKNELRRTIVLSCHPPEPMVHQRRLPDPSPGNDGNDVYAFICPGIIEESDILLPTKKIASGNRQSRYRDFLRSRFCPTLPSYGAR